MHLIVYPLWRSKHILSVTSQSLFVEKTLPRVGINIQGPDHMNNTAYQNNAHTIKIFESQLQLQINISNYFIICSSDNKVIIQNLQKKVWSDFAGAGKLLSYCSQIQAITPLLMTM